ncbi:inter-alpha-trypsin inhibitor heavy chain H3-like isoform X3 [Corythoichthys intestinalis]|uniref:inter-alpha-trypsin inhibitor heavy chain H3-like isoform X3 n=1 Tax=Corythoichthys intestinalis TaxID=161448 RepID=UPI0025A68B91|nr:inter-alpha-trypsin inhibitor heavy chain H3-like isoform X3 [Corythoichthys intestinalis]
MMKRTVLYISIFGLLLAFGTTQPKLMTDQFVQADWEIYSFHINSTVTSRYATTVINSRVANRKDESQEIEFHVRIPKNAFITKFRMFMEGQVYDGVVKAKEEAKKQYTEAVSRGESAGIVSSVGRTLEEFKTSVTVAAHKKVTFELTYEELLKRTLGKYELQIHARPMQPVKDFGVDVHIDEKAGISFIDVKGGLSTGVLANAVTKTHVDKQASISFNPSVDQQKTCESCGGAGINGDLVIVYDVNRSRSLGDIETSNGYFVHHFAPSHLPRIPKNVVFLIDKSGSMHGKKIEQTRTALIHILNDLAEDDFFGLITFDHSLAYWKRELVQANSQNVDQAKQFAQNIMDRGGTNINDALLDGSRMLNDNPRKGSASILILLTDGDPTSGVTKPEQIQSNVMEAIQDKFPLYCLGFGFDVNFKFLEKLSLQNNGIARRIYADSDADLQLKGFYDEVANPLLTDVTMIYDGGANLTQTNFSQYYSGSEIVVAGQITDNNIDTFSPRVVAISRNVSIVFSEEKGTTELTDDSNIQRVWAYLTVKQLLQKELQLSGAEKEKLKNETLRLSLKYNFVTPLTSMVVTKPTKETTEVLDKPIEGPPPRGGFTFGSNSRNVGSTSQKVGLRRSQPRAGVIFSRPGVASTLAGSGRGSQALPWVPQDHISFFSPNFHAEVRPTFAVPELLLLPTYLPSVFAKNHTQFLHPAEAPAISLCFGIPGETILRLFHLPTGELSVNGELDTTKGFKTIVVHFETNGTITLDTGDITIEYGQQEQKRSWYGGPPQETTTVGSATVITRNGEVDITIGEMHLIILHHRISGDQYLWPVVKQKPSHDNAEGILAQKPAVYEEEHQPSFTRLKFNNQEVNVVSKIYVLDNSLSPPMPIPCWPVSTQTALHAPLGNFVINSI